MFDAAKLMLYGGILLALVAAGLWMHGHIKESGREEIRQQWRASTLETAEKARKAVQDAQAKANADNEQRERERQEKEQAQREAQQQSADAYNKQIRDLERRFRDALIHTPSCSIQSQEPLLCPIE